VVRLIVLGTSVLVDLLRAHEGAHAALRSAVDDGEQLAASVPTRVEVPGLSPSGHVPDFIIAATALHQRAPLWTRNVEHLPMFDDLSAPY